MRELKKVYPDYEERIDEVREKKASVIGDLNQAHITSRYLPVEFGEFQVKEMLRFNQDLIEFLKEL